MQKQLRFVKKELANDMSIIRHEYSVKKQVVSNSGTLSGLFFGKKYAGSMRQSKRTQLATDQKRALQPYENVKNVIDQLLLKMDSLKLSLEEAIQAGDKKLKDRLLFTL
jgi:hypothetical protein